MRERNYMYMRTVHAAWVHGGGSDAAVAQRDHSSHTRKAPMGCEADGGGGGRPFHNGKAGARRLRKNLPNCVKSPSYPSWTSRSFVAHPLYFPPLCFPHFPPLPRWSWKRCPPYSRRNSEIRQWRNSGIRPWRNSEIRQWRNSGIRPSDSS